MLKIKLLSPLFFLASFFFAYSSELDLLLKEAETLKLHQKKYWSILLHYKSGWPLGTKSIIDDPKFFLAKNGKTNPENELTASIKYLHQRSQSKAAKGEQIYLSRYVWLKDQLKQNGQFLKIDTYETYRNNIKKTNYDVAHLIFPTAYMNNPASMYGHTFLNISSSKEKSILAKSIDYSALTETNSGLAFAVKGLVGSYKGYFSNQPYYKRIKEYSNLSQRDIWEYELDLNHEEITKIVYHLVELEKLYSNYFFFDENCSYNLLHLIEIARPSVKLTDNFILASVPSDTIKAVNKEGLIKKSNYRPSLATKIKFRASKLSDMQVTKVKKFVETNDPNFKDHLKQIEGEEKMLSLDLATEYLQYKRSNNEVSQKQFAKQFVLLLRERSKLSKQGIKELKIPEASNPIDSHDSKRISLGFGTKDDETFFSFKFRPVYHSLIDYAEGKLEGATINFFPTSFNYQKDPRGKKKLKLDHFHLFEIVSLVPRHELLKSKSYKISIGAVGYNNKNQEHRQAFSLDAGMGSAISLGKDNLLSLMLDIDTQIGSDLNNHHSIGFGPHAIGVFKLHRQSKTVIEAWKDYHILGETYQSLGVKATHNLIFNRKFSSPFPFLMRKGINIQTISLI